MASTALIWKIAIFISLCKIVHLLSNESSVNRREQYTCGDGWLQYDHYCYRALRIFITWEEAASTCSSFGGNLASVHSIEQHDFLNRILRQGRMNMWIGLHDREKDRKHVWEDGSDVDFTKWGPGQPTGYYATRLAFMQEDCVEMRYQPHRGATGDWNDEACSSKRAFICQTQIQTTNGTDKMEYDTSTINTTGKMEFDTSNQTVSTTDKMVYDTSIQAINTTGKMEYNTSIQTVSTTDKMEYDTSIQAINTTGKMEYNTSIQAINTTGKMEYDTSIQTVSTTHKMEYDTSIQAINTTGKMEYDTSIQTVSTTDKMEYDTSIQAVNTTGKMEYDTSIQTVSTTDKMEYDTSIQTVSTTDKMEYDTSIQTVNTTGGMECNKSMTISLTNFVISLILTAILCALFGQLIYYKRQWLQDKRTNLATVFFRSSKSKLSNNGSKENIISDWNQEGDRMQMYGVLKQ